MDKDITLLEIFANHYIQCERCRIAFETLHDSDYCETGEALFEAWYNEPSDTYGETYE